MKLLSFIFLLPTFGLFSTAWAGGYYCSSICVAIDSARSTLYILDELEIFMGGDNKRLAHRTLKKKCDLLGQSMRMFQPILLMDQINLSSSHTRDDSSSSSYDNSRGVDVSAGFALDFSYYSQRAGHNSSRRYAQNVLDVNIIPSDKDQACEYDESILEDYRPYTGNLDIL